MRALRSGTVLGLMGALVLGGCAPGEQDAAAAEGGRPREQAAVARPAAPTAAPAEAPPPPAAPVDSAAVQAAFARGQRLRAREVAELRQDVNAEQVASARNLGVRATSRGEMERLQREGRLVALGDSTPYWILREMDHSVPLVTPDARAMLVELGRRFHARLDSLGLPRYRMKVTSALRTPETQEELRKTNSYASQTTSAHEFGTTVDVSHERFAVPAAAGARERDVRVLEEAGKEHARVLQAELGRAIAALRDGGALHVMMENLQPVYHMTLARPAAAPAAAP